ncbi:MAG: lipid-A-disaccharide synthase [Planctomycetota bacterium]
MRIFFSVGEPSGDLHGANLIRQLRARCEQVECVGYGGPRMAQAGCQLQADLTQLAVMWLSRVILNLHKFLRLLWQADRYFRDQRPDAVVLIDYPGFNWWIARRAKARGIPVFYYGTPQLWAWAGWRVSKMRRFVDHVLCKLPFEPAWYAQRQCRATYVGHPYFDQLAQQQLDESLITQLRSDPRPLVTLLPGSRTQEVVHNLPGLLRAAALVAAQVPEVRIAIASFNQQQAEYATPLVRAHSADWQIHVGQTQELMVAARACLACSGSVSLELMYRAKPTVILYAVSRWGLWLQSFFRSCKYITLVNLLAHERIEQVGRAVYDPDAPDAEPVPFPEYLTAQDRSADMARWIVRWLRDEGAWQERVQELVELRSRFGHPGASERAAEYILRCLSAC